MEGTKNGLRENGENKKECKGRERVDDPRVRIKCPGQEYQKKNTFATWYIRADLCGPGSG